MTETATTAVILAAGKSTRMKSDLPKVLHEIFGRPMIEYVLDAARDAGASRILVVIGHEGDRVRQALAGQRDVEFVWQHDPQGTGHAVMVCEEQLRGIGGAVLVLAGDTPLLRGESLRELLAERDKHQAACVIGSSITEHNFGLGRIVRDGAGEFVKIVEQKDATPEEQLITEINTGCYAFETESLLGSLRGIDKSNQQGELYLTDAPSVMLRENRRVLALPSLSLIEAMGVNTQAQLAEVRRSIHRRHLDALLSEGVSILDPDKVDIDPRATVLKDTRIDPFTVIRGPARIGSRCRIGPHAVIDGATIPDDDVVGPFEHRRAGSGEDET
jgi:bifunctional UDP-N-acetylglucosamine pyrophosphorylase / glucosamine-1-phosphate N-acetyltransferase